MFCDKGNSSHLFKYSIYNFISDTISCYTRLYPFYELLIISRLVERYKSYSPFIV